MTTLDLINEHPFLEGLPHPWLDRLALQARRANYHQGYRLFSEGGKAEHFWLVRSGLIALNIHTPQRGDVVIETIGPGTVLGWSWQFPPYRWHFGAVAAEHTLTIRFDAAGVRRLCADEPALGYELSQRFMSIVMERLQATRVRLLDLYGVSVPEEALPVQPEAVGLAPTGTVPAEAPQVMPPQALDPRAASQAVGAPQVVAGGVAAPSGGELP
jgi:CRP-like cAMP-binding protein